MWFLYLLGIVFALFVDYIIARKFADIAEMKGHEGDAYFWFTFLLGAVGMLMVVALPTLVKENPRSSIVVPRTTAEADEWKCTCGKIHKNYESSCVCGVTKFEIETAKNTCNDTSL